MSETHGDDDIDRICKFAFVQLVEKAKRTTASAFLVALFAAVPYWIHTVLTDNGIQFRFPPRHAEGPTADIETSTSSTSSNSPASCQYRERS